MKPLGHWLAKRESLRGEIKKLENEVVGRLMFRSKKPVRVALVDKRKRASYNSAHLISLRSWRRAYNSWRHRAIAYANKMKELKAANNRLAYIEERIRLLTKTKRQLIKEDPFA